MFVICRLLFVSLKSLTRTMQSGTRLQLDTYAPTTRLVDMHFPELNFLRDHPVAVVETEKHTKQGFQKGV